jgi:phage protein D
VSYRINVPDYRVTLDGKDLTDRIRPRLVSMTLTDKRAGEADQLDIVIDDTDGRMALPKAGAKLTVQLGWKDGSDVVAGLVDKGAFTVDEIEHSGTPDLIVIRARSADFTSEIRTRREKSWHNTTIGAIVGDIAKRNSLQPRCAAALAAIAVKSLSQSRESDMALLRRLGREHDAVATVKRGALIFSPIGAGTTSGGKAIPGVTIQRRDGDRHSYKVEKREEGEGVSASYHDTKAAKKKTVTIGKKDKAKRLSRVYPTEAAAQRAAQSERKRQARNPVKFSYDLALGRADLYPERKAKVSGFKPEIDATAWLITEVVHTVTNDGYTTQLQMELAG